MWINLYSLTARLFYSYFWVNFLVLRLNLAFISCFHQPLDLWILSQSRILCYPISNLFTVLINLNLFYHVILYQSCIIQSQLPLPLNLKQRTKQSKYQINLIQLFLRFYLFIYLFYEFIYLDFIYVIYFLESLWDFTHQLDQPWTVLSPHLLSPTVPHLGSLDYHLLDLLLLQYWTLERHPAD